MGIAHKRRGSGIKGNGDSAIDDRGLHSPDGIYTLDCEEIRMRIGFCGVGGTGKTTIMKTVLEQPEVVMGKKDTDRLSGQQDGNFHHTQLKKIQQWPSNDALGLFTYMQSLWRWPTYITIGRKYIHVSTGGWSGHEEAMDAVRKNTMMWLFCWRESRRGGHYKFSYKKLSAWLKE